MGEKQTSEYGLCVSGDYKCNGEKGSREGEWNVMCIPYRSETAYLFSVLKHFTLTVRENTRKPR